MKKRLSLFFALILILSVLPVYAAADGEASSPAEEALRLAIKNGGEEYTLSDDLTLSADLTLAPRLCLTVAKGCTLTIPDGVTLTVSGGLDIHGSVVVADGGKLLSTTVINARGEFLLNCVQIFDGGSLTVDDGGEMESDQSDVIVYIGGTFCVNGMFTQTTEPIAETDYRPRVYCKLPYYTAEYDLPGVPPEYVGLVYDAFNEDALLSALSIAEAVPNLVHIQTGLVTMTLYSDTLIGKNVVLSLFDGVNIVVAPGAVLTNRGSIEARSQGVELIAEPGAEIRNYGTMDFYSGQGSKTVLEDGAVFWNVEPEASEIEQMNAPSAMATGGEQHRLFLGSDPDGTTYINVKSAEELAIALETGADTVRVGGEIVCGQDVTVPEDVWLWIQKDGALTVAEGYRLTNNGTVRVDGSLTVEGDYAGETVSAGKSAVITPDSVPRVTEAAAKRVMPGPFIDGPDSLETEEWGVYSVCAYAENGEPLYVSDTEWDLIFVTDAPQDMAFYHDTGELYAGTSPGEITLQAITEYGTCEKTVTVVTSKKGSSEAPFTPEPFIDGPDFLEAGGGCGYSVCAYDENGQKFYLDAEWSIVETDIADATIDAGTGLLDTGFSPGKIVLRATTIYGYGTFEKTVTVGPYEGLVIPVWAAVLVLAVLLAAIVFAVVRIVIAVRRRKKRKS